LLKSLVGLPSNVHDLHARSTISAQEPLMQ